MKTAEQLFEDYCDSLEIPFAPVSKEYAKVIWMACYRAILENQK